MQKIARAATIALVLVCGIFASFQSVQAAYNFGKWLNFGPDRDSIDFTVSILNTAPSAPTLVSPAAGSYTNDTTPELSANYSDDDTGDTGTTNYRIASTTAADCLNNLNIAASGASAETATISEATTWSAGTSIGADGTYYWCAQNHDGVAASAWTSMGSLILDTASPLITSATVASDNSYVTVNFSEGVYTTTGSTGALTAADFTLTFTQNGGTATNVTIASVTHTAGGTSAQIYLTITGTPSGVETIEITPASGTSIYNSTDVAMGAAQTTGAKTLNDLLAPTITNATSSVADGGYGVDEIIPITLTFSGAVTSTGNVTITVETGTTDRQCTFIVTNETSGTCSYIVQAGDVSADLQVSLISGSIADAAGNVMTNFTPTVNLAANKNIIIDTTTPDIVAVDSGASSLDRISLTSGTWFKASAIGDDDLASFSWTDPASGSDDTFYYDYADSGLVGWWQMDESIWNGTTDEAVDSSGSGNHGTASGGVTATTTASGKIARAGSFDGINDYLDIGTTSQNLQTIAFWIKPVTTTESILDLDGGTHEVSISAGTITATGFATPTIYVNGAAASTVVASEWSLVAITTATAFSASDFDIGRISTSYFEGYIDEVKIYNRALTSAEITAEYAARNGTTNAYIDSQALVEGDGNFHVRPKNGAGTWGTERSFNSKYDKTAPIEGSTAHFDGFQSSATISITVDRGSDPLSGMSATDADYLLEYRSATLTTGTCGTYGAWTDTAAAETAIAVSYNFTGTTANCYQFRYTVADAIGNTATFTSDDTTKVDTTTPDILAIDAGASSADRVSLTSGTWFKASDIGSDDLASFSWTDPSSASDDTFYYELNAAATDTVDGTESSAATNYIDLISITEGTNYFHVRPQNGSNTWGVERTFEVKYDKTNPTVQTTTLTSPNGGEIWTGGGAAAYDITWTAADFTDATSGLSATPITLEYSINSGVDWTSIATGEANDGTYSWTTPDISDAEVRIRITATDLAGNTSSDTSDADFRLSAHDNWIALYIIDGNNQIDGMDATLATDLKMRVGNGADSLETFAGANGETVTFTLYTVPEVPTAAGQALANGSFGTTFGGTSVVKTVTTDASGYASVILTLGDRAGEYTVVGNFTGCETAEASRTFTATEREEFKLTLSDTTANLDVSPTANTSDSAPTTLSVTTNAASFQITLDPDTWPSNPTLETIGNWSGGLGFAWDNNNSGTTGGVTDPTAFPGGLDASTIYTCSGTTCQGANEFTLDLHTAIDYTYEAGTYQNTVEVEGASVSF